VFLQVRRLFAGLLVFLMAAPGASAEPIAAEVQGSVTLEGGRSLPASVELRLVDLDTGRVVGVKTDGSGRFETQVSPGLYGLDLAKSGYEIVGGPHVLAATPGHSIVASLAVSPRSPEAAEAPSGPRIVHEALGCMPADENPEVEAVIEPAASVQDPRVYFHAARDTKFYYVDMMPEVGRFVACLPPPKAGSGPITYYIAASAGGVESRIANIEADVIGGSSSCPVGRRMAVVCPCAGPVAAYLQNGILASPPGFAAGTALGAGIGSSAIKIGTAVGILGIGLLLGDNGAPASPSR